MGLTTLSLEVLLNNHRNYFYRKKVLALGVFFPYVPRANRSKLEEKGVDFKVKDSLFARNLFTTLLGASLYHELDVSPYQGAEIIHSLNQPIPHYLCNSYDVVLDLGTLEHLSDNKQAINNIFSFLRNGGVYYCGTVVNNMVDHGFFQFSPTYFYDLTTQNDSINLIEMLVMSNAFNLALPYVSPDDYFSGILTRLRHPLAILSIIQKVNSENINFDLIQSKYRIAHESSPGLAPCLTKSGSKQSRRYVFMRTLAKLIKFTPDFITRYLLYALYPPLSGS